MKPSIRIALLLLPLWLLSFTLARAEDIGSPQRMELPGAHNVFRVTDWLYSGSQPETEASFAELQRRGIKTIVSVDGAKPDTTAAAKFGLRYIHLPIGYDGISRERAVELSKVAATVAGPIYMHCHHGLHRGPTAAAVMCMAREGWAGERAETWLREAGTATDYRGLYQAVRAFQPPTREELAAAPGDFPATAPVPAIVDAMVAIDERFDLLKSARAAGWKKSTAHPDVDLPHEALLLHEQFGELLRAEDTGRHTEEYRSKLHSAQDASGAFEAGLRAFAASEANAAERLEESWKRTAQSCVACHQEYRNKK